MHPYSVKHLWIGVGGGTLLFLGLAFVVYRSMIGFMETSAQDAKSHEIRLTLEHITGLIDSIDNSHRAYIISGEVYLLEPYNAAEKQIGGKITRVQELTGEKPRQRERLARFAELVTQRLEAVRSAVDRGRFQDFAAARAMIQSDQSTRDIREIHTLLNELIQEEERELSTHSERSAALAQSTILFVSGGSLMALAFALGAGVVYRLDHVKRRRIEEALTASETNQSLITQTLPVVTYRATVSDTFGALWVSENIATVSGFSSRMFIEDANLWVSRLHPDDREQVLREFQHVHEAGIVRVEYRWQIADGTYRWFLDHAVLQKPPGNSVPELTGLWLDITGQKQVEEMLREVNDQLVALIRASPIGIVILDAAGNCELWNPAAEAIFGWREEEVLGCPLPTVAPDQADEHQRLRERVLKDEAFTDMEVLRSRKDGTQIHISLSTAPLRDRLGHITGLIGLMADVSQRKQDERRLYQSNEKLRALAQRIESVREEESSRIAREIHDELGQLLTSVKLDLAWIAKRFVGPDRDQTRMEIQARIPDLMQTIEAAIQSVREIATALRPRILDELGLGPAMEWQAQDFDRRTGVRCQLSLPTLPLPIGPEQATALFRIFQEILTNVTRHAEATLVRVRLEVLAGMAELEVADDGRGITDQELNRWTSLGLIGMRERAEQLNGTLSICGSPGKGTTITVLIPLAGGVE